MGGEKHKLLSLYLDLLNADTAIVFERQLYRVVQANAKLSVLYVIIEMLRRYQFV